MLAVGRRCCFFLKKKKTKNLHFLFCSARPIFITIPCLLNCYMACKGRPTKTTLVHPEPLGYSSLTERRLSFVFVYLTCLFSEGPSRVPVTCPVSFGSPSIALCLNQVTCPGELRAQEKSKKTIEDSQAKKKQNKKWNIKITKDERRWLVGVAVHCRKFCFFPSVSFRDQWLLRTWP